LDFYENPSDPREVVCLGISASAISVNKTYRPQEKDFENTILGKGIAIATFPLSAKNNATNCSVT